MKTKLFPGPAAVRVICLAALAAGAAAAPAATKKQQTLPPAAPPPPPVVVEPPPKPSWLKRLKGPFSREAEPAAPAQAAPAPPAKVTRKSGIPKGTAPDPAVKPGPPAASRPPASAGSPTAKPAPGVPAIPPKSLATAKTRKPAPAATSAPATATAQAAAPAAETKKPGFFSRLKNKLSGSGEGAGLEQEVPAGRREGDKPEIEKPERPADWQERFVVTEDSAGFYEFGPSQAGGADLRLNKGQVVKITQAGKGWTRVEIEGGRVGYIGSDQIRQAAETDFSSARSTPAALASTGGGNPKAWVPAAPMPDLPDLPMAPGMENSLLLMPPLDGQGPLVRKGGGSPGLEPPDLEGLTLKPGDTLDSPPTAKDEKAPAVPASDTETNPPAAEPGVSPTAESDKKPAEPAAPESVVPESAATQESKEPAPPVEPAPAPVTEPTPTPAPATPSEPAPAVPSPAPVDPPTPKP